MSQTIQLKRVSVTWIYRTFSEDLVDMKQSKRFFLKRSARREALAIAKRLKAKYTEM